MWTVARIEAPSYVAKGDSTSNMTEGGVLGRARYFELLAGFTAVIESAVIRPPSRVSQPITAAEVESEASKYSYGT